MSPTEKSRGEAQRKVLYTAKTRTSGGRETGIARSFDGRLDVKLSLPGSARIGTNPEQLFCAGWSACFESAIRVAAHRREIALPQIMVDGEINLHQADSGEFISARFSVNLPGLDRNIAKSLIAEAEQICAYSKATRGNIDTVFTLA